MRWKVEEIDLYMYVPVEQYVAIGGYLAHLTSLTEDPAVKQVDKQRIKSYILKWHNSKVHLECAYFMTYYSLLLPSVWFFRMMSFV